MRVDIGCGADIAVPQPFLNLLQTHAIGIQQAGTAMSQIMKTYLFQLVLCQENLEMLGDEIGLHQFSDGVYIDVIQVVTTVTCSANLTVDFLLFFNSRNSFSKGATRGSVLQLDFVFVVSL